MDDMAITDDPRRIRMRSSTGVLRELLDERGVEWMDDSYAQLWCTVWHGQDGKQWRMTENQSGMLTELKAWKATPAQAIAATLGRGECRIEKRHGDWYCTGCGDMVGTDDTESELYIDGNAIELWHFCPNCGRRIVEVGE